MGKTLNEYRAEQLRNHFQKGVFVTDEQMVVTILGLETLKREEIKNQFEVRTGLSSAVSGPIIDVSLKKLVRDGVIERVKQGFYKVVMKES